MKLCDFCRSGTQSCGFGMGLFSYRQILTLALLPFACAKVTTNYPDIDGGLDGGASGSANTGGAGGSVTSIHSGGTTATGGVHATGGMVSAGGTGGVVGTGGTVSGSTGGTKATGGTSTVAGTGGAPATGGSPVIIGDAGTSCAAGAAFCDDFESYAVGGPASQWTATTGTWSVATDTTETAGDQQVYSNKTTGNASSQAGTGTYANASIEARMRVMSFSSSSASNSAGIFLRSNGSNDYDLSLGGDGIVYLRRSPTSSTGETCSSGTNSGTGLAVTTSGSGWFRLKLTVTGTVAAGITVTGYVDPTGGGAYTQVLQCTQSTGTQYMYDSGTAGVFAKGNAPAEYDNVIITNL